jgi:hypothetical protein
MPRAKPTPAPDENVWWTGLKWTLAAHMQLERIEEAFFEQINAELDAGSAVWTASRYRGSRRGCTGSRRRCATA